MATVKDLEGFELGDSDLTVWRYMSLANFNHLLKTQSLYFSSAAQFEDLFEGSLPDKEFIKSYYRGIDDIPKNDLDILKKYHKHTSLNKAFEALNAMTKISCWHINNSESHLMWKSYARQHKGVAIKTTIRRLKASLKEYKIKPAYEAEQIWIGKVKYVDFELDNTASSMLSRFFYKKKFYSGENEVRLAISLRIAQECGITIPKQGILVPVELNTMIQEIYCVNQKLQGQLEEKIKSKGLNCPVNLSEALGNPVY